MPAGKNRHRVADSGKESALRSLREASAEVAAHATLPPRVCRSLQRGVFYIYLIARAAGPWRLVRPGMTSTQADPVIAMRWRGFMSDAAEFPQPQAPDAESRSVGLIRLALQSAPVALATVDADLRVTWFYGPGLPLAPQEVLGLRIQDITAATETEKAIALFRQVLDTNQQVRADVIVVVHGQRFLFDVSAQPMYDDAGRVNGVASAWLDVTIRQHIADALWASEEKFRNAFENVGVGMAIVALDGRFLKVNGTLARLLGRSREELTQASVPGLTTTDNPDDFALQRLLAGEQQWIRTERQLPHRDGRAVPVILDLSLVHDAQGKPDYFIAQVHERTAEYDAADRLRQTDKTAAIARLAGGIAHDFNNILTIIRCSEQLLLEDTQKDDPRRLDIEAIRAASDRATALTRQLMVLGQHPLLQPRVLDLNEIIVGLRQKLHRLIPDRVRLELHLDRDPCPILADSDALEEAVVQLVSNGRDAMPAGGPLVVATARVSLVNSDAARIGVKPGDYVMMTVQDAGSGIDTATRARLFEPYFTVSGDGHGGGLGLATVHGLTLQSGGNVTIDSQPSSGTTVSIYLPRATAPAAAESVAPSEPASSVRGETILVVDDEPAVRAAARRVLERSGFHVLEAASGQEALDLLLARTKPVALVLSDLTMPQMSGRQLVEAMQANWADLRIALMSGHTDDEQAHQLIADARAPFLRKPFTPKGLLRLVTAALQQRKPPA